MFERRPLRDDIGAEILGRVIDGRLRSGTRINESHLSVELGISRTPLREAMLCLATAGVLDSDMGRGFSVPHYTRREIAELSETLAVLLPAAVRTAGELELKDQVEARNLIGRARLHQQEPAVFCEHFYLLLRLLGRQGPNALLGNECHRLSRLILRYLHEALIRGWDPESVLSGLQEGLQALQQADHGTAAAVFERVFTRLSLDMAYRFPANLEARV